MRAISEVKKDREFYQNFGTLIEALKGIAIAQYHSLEKRIVNFEEFMKILEGFFAPLDFAAIDHPFLRPKNAPLGVIAFTSDAGLLGGLNHSVMMTAFRYVTQSSGSLIVVGFQGQKIAQGYGVPCRTFTGIEDDKRYKTAVEIRDYLIEEILSGRIGPVKVIYPFAVSIKIQQVGEQNLLPPSEWGQTTPSGGTTQENAAQRGAGVGGELLLETAPDAMVEYLATVWLGQKFYDILQMSRLAEFAARTIHLEDSTQKIKDIDKKLRLQYFRARHEVIDQQMRELFTGRTVRG